MHEGPWVKFDRYVLVNEVLTPADGARPKQYEPWKSYEWARRGRKERPAPYDDLLQLLPALHYEPAQDGSLRDDEGVPVSLTSDSRDRLLDWCQQHGLLGVLPHRARLITLAPCWLPGAAEHVDEAGNAHTYGTLAPHQNMLVLTSAGWRGVGWTGPVSDSPHALPGDLVAPDEVPTGWSSPSVVIEDWLGMPKQANLRNEVWRFFPAVPQDAAETYQYPLPPSERFWREYGEPLDDFLRAALRFRRAVELLQHTKTRTQGLMLLHLLVGPVRLGLDYVAAEYQLRWRCPSLLASFAMMLIQDLAQQRRVRQCKACGRVFVADAYQAVYCSLTCRYREHKRSYRRGLARRHRTGEARRPR